MLMPRADFRKMAEGAIRNSFMHSFLAKGRLLYTHDETIADDVLAAASHRGARHATAAAVRRLRRRCRRFTRPTSCS